MCDDNDNIEHLYILPSRWLYLLQFKEFSGAIYENFQNARCMPIKFFVEEDLDSWHPKTHCPCKYLQSFYLAALIHKCGKKNNIHLQSIDILVHAKGHDHLIKKVITMELLRRLLMMNSHQNIRKVMGKISMPTSMHLWTGGVKNL